MSWFRLYVEVLDDPKVQRLDGNLFKAWINVLCLASRNDGILPGIEDLSFALRVGPMDAQSLLDRLLSAGLIDKHSGGTNGYRYAPHNWSKRQYKSDTSTGRVKRFRERRKSDAESAPETETETETETDPSLAPRKKRPISDDFEPKQFGAKSASRVIVDSWSPLEFETQLQHFKAHHRATGKQWVDWQAAWETWVLNSKRFAERYQTTARRGEPAETIPSFAELVLAEAEQRSRGARL